MLIYLKAIKRSEYITIGFGSLNKLKSVQHELILVCRNKLIYVSYFMSLAKNLKPNIMKRKIVFLLMIMILFSSCIVKSIQPFYTIDSLSYDKDLVGEFTDAKKSKWTIYSFKEEWEAENSDPTKIMKEDRDAYDRYKDGYVVKYVKKETESFFIAMPFKVDEHLFLDFTPFQYEDDALNPLVAQHLLKTHSVAKVDLNTDGSIKFSWLSEEVINPLFNENKIRLKHERTGVSEDLVLTATSEELHSFLVKFMKSDLDKKWDKDDIYTLTPQNTQP